MRARFFRTWRFEVLQRKLLFLSAQASQAAELAAAYETFEAKFAALDSDGDGFISGAEARLSLLQSELPTEELRQIWDMSDMRKNGGLDKHEFVISMLLIQRREQGLPLPDTLPLVWRTPPKHAKVSPLIQPN
jgi:hypothetical protein